MRPKKQHENADLFRSRLDQIIDHRHPLYQLANQIEWSYFEEKFGERYVENVGSPGKPIRLMVGLHYLKYTFNESDESLIERFIENPYWQYFCGFEYFQHTFPIDPSSMTRFRQRIGWSGAEELLKEALNTAKRSGYLKKSHLNKVNVDTTVQEKAIAFPTDARLYHKMRETLVRAAGSWGIQLRQSYRRLSKKALARQARYGQARQLKRAGKMTRKLKTYLGCVYRDIKRKVEEPDEELNDLLLLAERLLNQKRNDSNKIYSIHAREVECISKGKAHKRYEFGCKVGMVTSSRDNWILGIRAYHGNPYDGHTLKETLSQMQRLTGWKAREAYADLGYRGHGYQGETRINIVNYRQMKKLTRAVKKWFKRRSAIEPIFGHVKYDNRMDRNHLRGQEGDQINAILSACGFNMRKLLAVFLCLKYFWQKFSQKLKNSTLFYPEMA
ncbi:MAG: IS5 family transposase [Aliifodinibius sp.]|nr:IS5 family transposase [Fodinibius sp.]NIV10893.1 IS5 family transposase [Fodinibius sp.]NIY24478.1 IS5 family transposase [Fodinibius sp.]